ncbi:uncharacterized protein fend isoform X2 [Cloeon dipterum]|uniref:uncharacterized protein fend isoform X2 n=1 Tax=Cloeon dipterum TaxID=197152 RepID=UPI00321FB2B8
MQVLVWLVAAALAACRAAVLPPPLPRPQDVDGPLTVATCRALCLQKFASGKEDTCLQQPDCFMCWKKCELLQTNYGGTVTDCSNPRDCYAGCQVACKFYEEKQFLTKAEHPVTHAREALKLSTLPLGAGVISWAPLPKPNLVYLLVARPSNSIIWREISQSTESEVRLESGHLALEPNSSVSVMAVGPKGLVSVLTLDPSKVPHPKSPDSLVTKDQWRLQEVSMHYKYPRRSHEGLQVITEVSWEPQAPNATYIVTWELAGGGLKGNLFTGSTNVSLSLWTDTIYYIQVELVGAYGKPLDASVGKVRSEMLMLDTSPATPAKPVESLPRVERKKRQLTEEMLAVSTTSPIVSVMRPKDCCEEAAAPSSAPSFPSIQV